MKNLFLNVECAESLIVNDVVASIKNALKGLSALQYVADLNHEVTDDDDWHAGITEKITNARNTFEGFVDMLA